MVRAFLLLFITFTLLGADTTDFHRGVNLTQWFQVDDINRFNFTKFTKKDFEQIKSLGCDVIRLPIQLNDITGPAPNYELDSRFLYFLDQVVNWVEDLELHLILDNHTFNPLIPTNEEITDPLIPVWKQMAAHFKHRSEYLYYEILNEPHGIDATIWNTIQGNVIDAIRDIDTTHTIIVGGHNYNSYHSLAGLPRYADDNLIYTYHFYDPFLFTHQGATWVDPSMVPLANIPFPYIQSEMPSFPTELEGSWLEYLYNDYHQTGTVGKTRELLAIGADFQQESEIPLLCGELGVYIPNSEKDDRIFWYKLVTDYLSDHNIAWTLWDYKGGFGLFEKNSAELFDYHLNVELLEAIGFNIPPQSEYVPAPDSSAIKLYTDYLGKHIDYHNWYGGEFLDFYSITDPFNGEYCIHWKNAKQYEAIRFDFAPDKDLSYLLANNFAMELYVKSASPPQTFDVRFVDSDEGDDDHPWRMHYTITEEDFNWNGEWQHIQIQLSEFSEQGAWEDEWFNPAGKFDWSKIDRFMIVAEQGPLTGVDLYFDDITIIDPNQTDIINKIISPEVFLLEQNFPNPFNPTTRINYYLPRSGEIKLAVYDLKGAEVMLIDKGFKLQGRYSIIFNGTNLPSGTYFYRLHFNDHILSKKCILMK